MKKFISFANSRHKKRVRNLRVKIRKFRDAAWDEAQRHAALIVANEPAANDCWAKFRPGMPPGSDAMLAIDVLNVPTVIS